MKASISCLLVPEKERARKADAGGCAEAESCRRVHEVVRLAEVVCLDGPFVITDGRLLDVFPEVPVATTELHAQSSRTSGFGMGGVR